LKIEVEKLGEHSRETHQKLNNLLKSKFQDQDEIFSLHQKKTQEK